MSRALTLDTAADPKLFDRTYGYVIYSTAMAANAMQPVGLSFGATLYTDRGIAAADALAIGEHEGVKGCVVLNARTLERVDFDLSARHRRR